MLLPRVVISAEVQQLAETRFSNRFVASKILNDDPPSHFSLPPSHCPFPFNDLRRLIILDVHYLLLSRRSLASYHDCKCGGNRFERAGGSGADGDARMGAGVLPLHGHHRMVLLDFLQAANVSIVLAASR